MNRLHAFEVSPVVETDVDGMGGLVCQAFPSLAEAKTTLSQAHAERVTGRILWTLYGHTSQAGAEAICDCTAEEAAFALLYKLTGIAGTPGVTLYKLPHAQTFVVWTCTSDDNYGMVTSVHPDEHAAQAELFRRIRRSLTEEEQERGKSLLASGQEHDGYEAFSDFVEAMTDAYDSYSVEPHTLAL